MSGADDPAVERPRPIEFVAKIAANWPVPEWAESKVELWADELAGLSPVLLDAALSFWLRFADRAPSLREIRGIAEMLDPEVPCGLNLIECFNDTFSAMTGTAYAHDDPAAWARLPNLIRAVGPNEAAARVAEFFARNDGSAEQPWTLRAMVGQWNVLAPRPLALAGPGIWPVPIDHLDRPPGVSRLGQVPTREKLQ